MTDVESSKRMGKELEVLEKNIMRLKILLILR